MRDMGFEDPEKRSIVEKVSEHVAASATAEEAVLRTIRATARAGVKVGVAGDAHP
jgi:hypothetical protein